MNPPTYLYVGINRTCNLKCQHCTFWTANDHPDALKMEQIEQILNEFAAMNPKGIVVTCGGEASISPKFWPSCATVRELGLRLLKVTNGTTIKTAEDAAHWVNDGPHEITISLDGPDAETHDTQRGVAGSFDRACRALGLLLEARERYHRADTRIFAMTVVGGHLEGKLDRFFNLVLNEIGADKLKLNIMQPSFGASHEDNDPWFMDNFPTAELTDEIRTCDTKYGINRNPRWYVHVDDYFSSIRIARYKGAQPWASLRTQTTRQLCNSAARNIWVNDLGGMTLCPSPVWPSVQWQSYGNLQSFWNDAHWRGNMLACKKLCGISHSVRRSNSTLDNGDSTS